MKCQLLFILSFFWATTLVAQKKCICPPNVISSVSGKEPSVSFSLNKDISIGVCGEGEVDDHYDTNEKIYSETYIFDCSSNDIIYEWYALQPCTINKHKDTVFIKELFLLPIGKNFSYKWSPFYITEIFPQNGIIKKRSYHLLNKDLYTQEQINNILQTYRQADSTTYEWNSEEYLNLCSQLFWCYISGNKKAEEYLNNAKKKFGGFSGYIAEEYSLLIRTIEKIKTE